MHSRVTNASIAVWLAGALVIMGCKSTPQPTLDDKMRSWLGHGSSDLVASWGPPHNIMKDKNGEILDILRAARMDNASPVIYDLDRLCQYVRKISTGKHLRSGWLLRGHHVSRAVGDDVPPSADARLRLPPHILYQQGRDYLSVRLEGFVSLSRRPLEGLE
jgi:hypothetical protein